MRIGLTDVVDTLARSRELIDNVLSQTEGGQQRALLLPETLRALWPSLPLYAVLLQEGDYSHVGVVDGAGQPRREWAGVLGQELTRDGVMKRKGRGSVKLPAELQLSDYCLAVQRIIFRDCCFGALALAVPKSATTRVRTVIHTLLTACAEHLALRLLVEQGQREHRQLQDALARQFRLANLGDLAGSVTHEFNNFLNTILLHLAVIEQDVAEHLRPDLAEIRRQGRRVTLLVKQLQSYRQQLQSALEPIDLNGLVSEAIAAFGRDRGWFAAEQAAGDIAVALAPDVPAVLGTTPDLKRLLTFLVTNAAAAGNGKLTIRTERAGDRVLLRVEDSGPEVPAEQLGQLFESDGTVREGTNHLELACCKAIVRRMQGAISAANRPEGGVAISVELIAAPE